MKKKLSHVRATTAGPLSGAMQAALDALDCQVAVVAASGDVVVANEAWRRMAASDVPCATHAPPERNYLQAVHEDGAVSGEARQAVAGVHAVLARRMTHFSIEYPCHTHGRNQWFHMDATACEVSGSAHAVLVHRSIPSSRTEDELRLLLTRKEEFLAILLHELRNPLAPIINALELLGRQSHDAQTVLSARGIIQRQIRQITRLVDDLFDVSRIKRESVEMRHSRVDMADVIQIAIESAQPLIDARGHTLTANVTPNRYIVQADATRLAQVLTNLLINAAKYTPRGGNISVIAERTEGEVMVRVRDSGVGIAAEHLNDVFELFAQPASVPESRMGGLGIGLALARELMRLQGGTISAHSEGIGRGSEFTITLPRAASE
jgi:signal transduction histidine kinase